MYTKVIMNNKLSCVRKENGACIPICEDNRDYQDYIEWLAKDNTPTEEIIVYEANS